MVSGISPDILLNAHFFWERDYVLLHIQDEMKLYYVCTAEGCGYRWTE